MKEGKICLFNYIKSAYNLKLILSILELSKKLEIIKYSKNVQTRIDIKLDDYKNFSGLYYEEGENGIIKFYDLYNKKLLFEGEYKNSKKNGKGKEYYENGRIKFEGEYLDGKRINGKGYDTAGTYIFYLENSRGREFYKNYKIKYEGEYIGNKRWNGKLYDYEHKEVYEIVNGKVSIKEYIKEYNYYGYKIYEGEYNNGTYNGKGKGYWQGNLDFEGEYLNGLRLKGKEYDIYSNKVIYEGNYLKGKRHKDKEYYVSGKLKYEGEFLDGKYNGLGKEYNYYGLLIYEGEYSLGLKNGTGKEYDKNQLVFEGEYLNGERWNGNGSLNETTYDNKNIITKYKYINGKSKIIV